MTLTTHSHLASRLQEAHSYTSTPPLCLHGSLHSKLYLYLLHLSGIIKYGIMNHNKQLNTKFSLTPVTLNLHNSSIPKSSCMAQNLLDILCVTAGNFLLKSTNFINAQYLYRLTMGWMVRDRILVGTRFSARPDRPWGTPSLL